MGLELEAFRVAVEVSIRASVSETVDGGEVERRAISDSIAAMGFVISWSFWRRWV